MFVTTSTDPHCALIIVIPRLRVRSLETFVAGVLQNLRGCQSAYRSPHLRQNIDDIRRFPAGLLLDGFCKALLSIHAAFTTSKQQLSPDFEAVSQVCSNTKLVRLTLCRLQTLKQILLDAVIAFWTLHAISTDTSMPASQMKGLAEVLGVSTPAFLTPHRLIDMLFQNTADVLGLNAQTELNNIYAPPLPETANEINAFDACALLLLTSVSKKTPDHISVSPSTLLTIVLPSLFVDEHDNMVRSVILAATFDNIEERMQPRKSVDRDCPIVSISLDSRAALQVESAAS